MPMPGKKSSWFEGFERYDFVSAGCPATVICPRTPAPGRLWAWKGEFLDAFPGTELALLKRGVTIAYLSFPNQFGSPAAVARWNTFYTEMTGVHGFARKVALIGLSRGGLYCYQWAIANPDRVACLFGDAPVCDMRSWPGGKGEGRGSPADWQKMKEVFGFSSESDAMAFKGNPVDNLAPLAAAHVPLLHVYGDADDVVPWQENTGVVATCYRALGGSIELIGKPGCAHHPHGLEDPTPVADFILRHLTAQTASTPRPKWRLAIMGYRHGHIGALVNHARARDDIEIVAACEEDPAARVQLATAKVSEHGFDSYAAMLDAVDIDIIGIGDYYGKRGALAIEALNRGKHVISDKPICTRLSELDEIERLARERRLSVGCMFDLRDAGNFRALRRIVRGGALGEIHALSFGGQHPLMYGSRPAWYFEEGKHGGTLNDIAIHATDLIPWLTGRRIATINAARAWNAKLREVPHFRDAAQVMMTLDNGAGVLGDVSYLVPDRCGYGLPQYWRTTVWGSTGMAETSAVMAGVMVAMGGDAAVQQMAADPATSGGYLEAFVAELRGESQPGELCTQDVLRAARTVLLAQSAADQNLTNVAVP